ncbi:MAG TPA: hypothetical protein VFP94_00975, partial [Terriglobales bacterium]|nr:hypothetical protein [Terriglobales bacterium]
AVGRDPVSTAVGSAIDFPEAALADKDEDFTRTGLKFFQDLRVALAVFTKMVVQRQGNAMGKHILQRNWSLFHAAVDSLVIE